MEILVYLVIFVLCLLIGAGISIIYIELSKGE